MIVINQDLYEEIYQTLINVNNTPNNQVKLINKINNRHIINSDKNCCQYCLERIEMDEIILKTTTLYSMMETNNLLWNALPALVPLGNIEDLSALKNVLVNPSTRQQYDWRLRIGSALIYFCPFDCSYSLRSAAILIPTMRRFIKKTNLRKVTKFELQGFVDLYNKRLGNIKCFIVNYPFGFDESGKIHPLCPTPQDIAKRHKEIIAYINTVLNKAASIEDYENLYQWLDDCQTREKDLPGIESTIARLRTKTQNQIIHFRNSLTPEFVQ